MWRGLTGISCPAPQPRSHAPNFPAAGPLAQALRWPLGHQPCIRRNACRAGAEAGARFLSPPHGAALPCAPLCSGDPAPASPWPNWKQKMTKSVFFFLMKCHCWRWCRQGSGSISRPRCPCSMVGGQGGHLPKPRTCLHRPGALTGPAPCPPSQSLQRADWCSLSDWILGLGVGRSRVSPSCEETPSPDPWLPAAPLPAPQPPCPPCVSLWVSWSFIFL